MLKAAAGAALVILVVWGAKHLSSSRQAPAPVDPPPAPVKTLPDAGPG